MEPVKLIAFIPAAGLGTRLHQETRHRPKALLNIHGNPMIYWIMNKLKSCGITSQVVNVHHHADTMITWLSSYQSHNRDLNLHISWEKEKLLDSGGALKFAGHFFEGFSHILVHNVDIFSDLNIPSLIREHIRKKNDVTLCVSNRETDRYLMFDNSMRLCGWENRKTGEQLVTQGEARSLKSYAFSGVYIINTNMIKESPEDDVFSVIPWLLHLSKDHNIFGFEHELTHWYDAGKPPSLKVIRDMNEEQFAQLTEL